MASKIPWTALAVVSALITLAYVGTRSSRPPRMVHSPRATLLPRLSQKQIDALPYALDDLPGGRYVETPSGLARVYEWGSEGGRKVLFVHGIGIPSIALGAIADHLSTKGCRVMLFGSLSPSQGWKHSVYTPAHERLDLFGRGYSDGPVDQQYSAAFFASQLMEVLAASPLSWLAGSEDGCFDLVGYSLGGGIAAHFARYHAHLVRSLILVAPTGVLRTDRIGWNSKLIYNFDIVPQSWRQWLARRRLKPSQSEAGPIIDLDCEPHQVDSMPGDPDSKHQRSNSDGSAVVVLGRSQENRQETGSGKVITVNAVLSWQLEHHEGFVPAYMSSMRDGPIYHEHAVWAELGQQMTQRRQMAAAAGHQRRQDKILFVLGSSDAVIDMTEVVEDAEGTIGAENMEVAVVDADHDLPFTKSHDVAQRIWSFWE